MKRIAHISRNLFMAIEGEAPNVGASATAEVIMTLIEPEYVAKMQPPLVEGGQPKAGIVKLMKSETVRFLVGIEGLETMMVALSAIQDDLMGMTSAAEPEAAPDPQPAPATS